MTRLVALFLSLGLFTAQAPAQELAYPELLNRLVDLDWLYTPPPAGERCVLFSSYDRAIQKGPKDAVAWYGNEDRGHYLRQEDEQYVMVDVDGPGCVARIWSANPKGRLFFYFDGAQQPGWQCSFKELLSGKLSGIPWPVAGVQAEGGNCYLPLPFAQRLKVCTDRPGLYYQVNVCLFAPDTKVASFTPALLQQQQQAIAKVAARWLQPPVQSSGLQAGRQVLLTTKESGVLRSLRLDLKPGSDSAAYLRQLRLLITAKGHAPLVDVPFGDFFACAPSFKPCASFALGVDAKSIAYCNLPMPLPAGSTVELVGDVSGLQFRQYLDFQPQPLPKDCLYFHAAWHQNLDIPTRPLSDHRVLHVQGRGRYVGTTLVVRNSVARWWGEGDEKFFVDGEGFPSSFGTGTEDYFGYAWCCYEPFSHAMHSQSQVEGPANYGYSCNHRLHLLDSVPFQESFRFDLEVWHLEEEAKVDYASTAYWYGGLDDVVDLPPMPEVKERMPRQMPVLERRSVAGALEAEGLRERRRSEGHVVRPGASSMQVSEGYLLWLDLETIGAELQLELPVAEAGRYRLRAVLVHGDDCGILQVRAGVELLSEELLSEEIDLYAPEYHTGKERDLGVVQVDQAGSIPLSLILKGSHAEAKHPLALGVDYFILEKQ